MTKEMYRADTTYDDGRLPEQGRVVIPGTLHSRYTSFPVHFIPGTLHSRYTSVLSSVIAIFWILYDPSIHTDQS
jgi:hypothetical protein